MAKGASTEKHMGALHATLATVFKKVLDKYEMNLAVIDKFNERDEDGNLVADDMMAAMVAELGEPNPAMLSAISKFLKDNEIMYDSEEISKLSSQERRLKDMAAKRAGNVVSLNNLPVADNG